MNKQAFIDALQKKLQGLPEQEVEERIAFFVEMIEDLVEDGFTEEEAVMQLDPVDKIAEQIIVDIPFGKLAKEKFKPKQKLRTWEIVLLAAGSPIWLALGASAVAVIFSLYVSLWSLVVSLWAVFVSLAASSLGCIAGSVIFYVNGHAVSGTVALGASLLCVGIAMFLFFACKKSTVGAAVLAKKIFLGIKKLFVKKEVK